MQTLFNETLLKSNVADKNPDLSLEQKVQSDVKCAGCSLTTAEANYSYINLGISVVKCGDCKTNMMVYIVYGINNVNTLCRY